MRPDRICPVCSGPKNEEDEMCNICLESGEELDEGDVDDLA